MVNIPTRITVIIPTYKRSTFLLDALKSVLAQQITSEYEVLVLDNGCENSLQSQVESLAQSVSFPLAYFPVSAPGLHNGRHAGAMYAQSDLLVYVDDDIIATPGWLEAIVEAFQDPEVQLVGGKCLPQYETEPPDWQEAFWSHSPDGQHSCGYLSLLDLGDKSFEMDPNYIWGLNFAIRKQTLVTLGGFNPDSMPWELRRYRGDGESALTRKVKALGLKAMYQPAALVYHRVPKSRQTVDYFERRAYLQGISDSFTNIRTNGGLFSPATSHVRLDWKEPLRLAKCLVKWVLKPKQPISAEPYKEIKNRVRAAHHAGYQYHQDEVRNDPALLEWVIKPDYWDGLIPPLQNTGAIQKGESS